ncbi:hypothetical protein Lal_00048925 [Lupinus albus]|nr:hypothetical protein Lal_00048925 [Lupinus albus]
MRLSRAKATRVGRVSRAKTETDACQGTWHGTYRDKNEPTGQDTATNTSTCMGHVKTNMSQQAKERPKAAYTSNRGMH